METEDKAKEIHDYYMRVFNASCEGVSIPEKMQSEMIMEVTFLLDTD